jgi:hypothetical protein
MGRPSGTVGRLHSKAVQDGGLPMQAHCRTTKKISIAADEHLAPTGDMPFLPTSHHQHMPLIYTCIVCMVSASTARPEAACNT